MFEKATMSTKCPKCGNVIVINKCWTPGGMNDYGSFEVKCNKCKHVFIIDVGRDVYDSSISSGAELIRRIDRE